MVYRLRIGEFWFLALQLSVYDAIGVGLKAYAETNLSTLYKVLVVELERKLETGDIRELSWA